MILSNEIYIKFLVIRYRGVGSNNICNSTSSNDGSFIIFTVYHMNFITVIATIDCMFWILNLLVFNDKCSK